MIKVGILGADSLLAGELIRILINHPETEISSLYAPLFTGRSASTLHHGLIGEIPLRFTDKVDSEEVDLFVIMDYSTPAEWIISNFENQENLKLISINNKFLEKLENTSPEAGVSEINRKALVRGANVAYIASPALVPALIALVPLANYLLLNSDISISVSVPEDLIKDLDAAKLDQELENYLKEKQSSFNGKINYSVEGNGHKERSLITDIKFSSNLPIEEIEKIYDDIYDDHNFTFLSDQNVDSKEVEGTQKTIISLKKPQPDILEIKVISDPRMRGGAGDIVHVMNLLFGLHEKTGLNLKPSGFINSYK